MPFKFGVDSSGNYGYIKDGADTVTPFLTRDGNATESQVLSGYTFSNASSSGLTGTMPNIKAIDDAIASNYVENGSSGTGIYARMNTGAHVTKASSGYAELFIPQSQIAGMFSATATAADITNGKTAWVNGVKITGARPASASRLTGTVTMPSTLRSGQSYSGNITFNPTFDIKPTVTYTKNVNSVNYGGEMGVTISNITRTGFSFNIYPTLTEYHSYLGISSFTWVAQI